MTRNWFQRILLIMHLGKALFLFKSFLIFKTPVWHEFPTFNQTLFNHGKETSFFFFSFIIIYSHKKKTLQGLQALQQFLKINKIIQYTMTSMKLLLET